jgi:pectate lyase
VNNNDGINTRDGAQLLIENNYFSNVSDPIYATDTGYAVAKGNVFTAGSGTNEAPTGTLNSVPYSYTLLAASSVPSSVSANAGAILSF